MSTPAMVVRVAADLAEFKRNLKEGLNQIETTTAGMQKLVNSLQGDKLIQQAHNVAAAINQIGGVTKLSTAELQRHGATIDKALDKYRTLGKEAPQALKTLKSEIDQQQGSTQTWGDKLANVKNLFSALIALKVVQWLKQGIQAALEYADTLDNLRVATGVSIEGLQRLEAIGLTSRVSMETLAKSVEMLHRKLDDKEAIKAIEQMGLNYAHIRALKPEEQFLEIAQAVAAIQDPVTKANAGAALFGKTWDTISPAIRGDLKAIGDATKKLSEDQVGALDRAGDAWDIWWKNQKTRLSALIADYALLREEMNRPLFQNPTAPTLPGAPTLKIGGGGDGSDVMLGEKELARILSESDSAIKKHIDEVKKAAEEYRKMAAAVNGSNLAWQRELDLHRALSVLGIVPELESRNFNRALGASDLPPNVGYIPGGYHFGGAAGSPDAHGRTMPDINAAAKANMSGAGPSTGTVMDSLKALKAEWLNVGNVGSNIAKGFLQNIGAMLSGGISSLISVGLGKLVSGVKALFHIGTEESTKVSPLRDEFFKLQGGLETLNPKVLALSGNLKLVDAVFKAKTVDQYNAAIRELTDLLAFQDKAMADLEATAKKYSFTLEELGPAMQRQNLEKQAQELYKDWQILNAGGIDHVAIVTRMSDSVNDYIHNALKMGAEVPESMRKMLEEMIQQGTLTDAAGNKIEDLEKSGLSFTMSMSEGFKALIDEVKKLTAAIAQGLGGAISNLPGLPDLSPNIRVPPPGGYQIPGGITGGKDYSGGFAENNYADSGGIIRGGRLLRFPPARGRDTVPVMAREGETITPPGMGGGMNATFGDVIIQYSGDPNDSEALMQTFKRGMRDNRAGVYDAIATIAKRAGR